MVLQSLEARGVGSLLASELRQGPSTNCHTTISASTDIMINMILQGAEDLLELASTGSLKGGNGGVTVGIVTMGIGGVGRTVGGVRTITVGRIVGGVQSVRASMGNNVGDVVGGTQAGGQSNVADEQTDNCGHVSWHVVNRASFVSHGTGSDVWRLSTRTPSLHNFSNDTNDRSSVHPTDVTHPETPPWQS